MKMTSILHVCVNFNNPLYSDFFNSISKYNFIQKVIYPIKIKTRKNLENIYSKRFSNVEYIKLSPSTIRFFYWYKILKIYRFILKRIDISSFSFIHAHTLFSDGGVALLLNIRKNKRFLVTIRETDFGILKYKPWLYFIGKCILKNSCGIICLSPIIKEKLTQFYKSQQITDKIQIIPNGIDDLFFSELDHIVNSRKPERIEKKIRLLYVGTFIARKNVNILIDFVKHYRNEYELTLVGGEGFKAVNYDNLINNSGNIKYIGRINNKADLIEIYNNCDIFVMLSKNETFGQVYLEAISLGKPVIYSKGTGIDKYFEDGLLGYSIDIQNYSDIVLHDSIQKIMDNYDKISQQCIQKSKEFKWDRIAKSYIELLNKI